MKKMKNIYYFLIIYLLPLQFFAQSNSISDTLKQPINLTAQEDHARLLKLLNIDSLRPGPSGNPNAPNAANSDEAKANPYPNLPDPLKLNNGHIVITPEMWWKQRRPEIKEYFDREIY
ncbi:MAG: acetylxylan esterase, partial [Ignavibacteriae bacterium]|nr:acetylxylan esterase [Ignavibacteriota bacterium]